jgi:hypothetical protein
MANIKNGTGKEVFPSFSSSVLPVGARSKTKVIKRHAIHLIRFCLKSGIRRNNDIVQILKENEVVLKGRTFDRYKNLAEKELENDLDADIWLSGKVQNASVHDYKDISDRYDRQLVLDDMLMQSLIMRATDKAIQSEGDPQKYYKHLDTNEMMKIQAISNYTMKNKLELISKGLMVYRIKKHIDNIHEELGKKTNDKTELKESSALCSPQSASASYCDRPFQACYSGNSKAQNEEWDQDFLDRNELVIGMAGIPIKKHLAEAEKKFGKPIVTREFAGWPVDR